MSKNNTSNKTSNEEKPVNKKMGEKKIKKTDKKSVKARPKSRENTKESAKKDKEIIEIKKKVEELNDKYLRLSAEYDNYRKRTLKEKIELAQSGGKDILVGLLPIVDDFERANMSMENNHDAEAVKEGIGLIYSKFIDFLKARGVKEIECLNKEFNTDEHEALTKIPASNKKLKGKVVDVIEKGYYLNDKVLRYSKVVVGE